MTSRKMRLDQILLREGLISEEQIQEALARQKAHGGKLGSHRVQHGYVDETSLVKALALQFNCEGVALSNVEIPDIILKMVPARVAVARKIVPFGYDPETNELRIACEDPTDQELIDEVGFVARGKKVKFTFDGREITGHEGETITAALVAAGVLTLSKSITLERPRGFFCGSGRCSSWMIDAMFSST